VNLTSIEFSELPVTKLFLDYTTNFSSLNSFFETDPFSVEAIEERLNSYSFPGDRALTLQFLKQYNQQFDAGDEIEKSLDKLADENAIAMVTGQQLTLFGGPLFTAYKILTLLAYSKKWEKQLNRPIVPVFWMADEDHDYEEAATIGVPAGDDFKKMEFETDGKGKRVFDIELGKHIEPFLEEIKNLQLDTDFSDQLWDDLKKFYQSDATFGEAFGKWILHLFGKHGLILAGSNHPTAKKLLSKQIQSGIENAEKNYRSLTDKSEELVSAGYHQQVHLQNSNLFWIDQNKNRQKISLENGKWTADGRETDWTTDSLIKDIEQNPQHYSPNVFLRPVLQNFLIPSVAYVAGPGEIAYYAQTKEYYRDFGVKQPIIIPRFSATLFESGVDRIFEKLPFKMPDYNQRIEDLEASYIEHAETPDIEKIFGQWRDKVSDVSGAFIKDVSEIDPTLKKSSEKVKAAFFTELDKLKGKVYRSIKDQEKTQLKRIRKIQANLFPERNLQEREVAFIYIMNKYGSSVWDRLLELFENESPDSHKIIRL